MDSLEKATHVTRLWLLQHGVSEFCACKRSTEHGVSKRILYIMSGGVRRTTTVRVTYVGPPATTKVAVEQERRAEHAAIVAVLRCASMLERHRLWFRKELSLRLSEMWIRDNFTIIEGCERGTTRVMNADEKLSRRNPSTHPHLTRAPKLVTCLKGKFFIKRVLENLLKRLKKWVKRTPAGSARGALLFVLSTAFFRRFPLKFGERNKFILCEGFFFLRFVTRLGIAWEASVDWDRAKIGIGVLFRFA